MAAIDPGCSAPRHGDETAYAWWGCRCTAGREAWRIYKKRLREGRQPPAHVNGTGTARRLQALAALGYSRVDLARRLNVSLRRVRDLGNARRAVVHRDTATRVKAIFDELSATPGPSVYARNVARRNGWMPPLAWDDIDNPDERPSLGEPDADTVDDVLVRRVLDGRAPYAALNEEESVELWRAYTRSRRTRGETTSGVRDFARTYGVTKSQAETLQLHAAGLNAHGKPLAAPQQQAA